MQLCKLMLDHRYCLLLDGRKLSHCGASDEDGCRSRFVHGSSGVIKNEEEEEEEKSFGMDEQLSLLSCGVGERSVARSTTVSDRICCRDRTLGKDRPVSKRASRLAFPGHSPA